MVTLDEHLLGINVMEMFRRMTATGTKTTEASVLALLCMAVLGFAWLGISLLPWPCQALVWFASPCFAWLRFALFGFV